MMGSTGHEFVSELPHVLGKRTVQVTDSVIEEVKQLTEQTDDTNQNQHPQKDKILDFFHQNRGNEVFVTNKL